MLILLLRKSKKRFETVKQKLIYFKGEINSQEETESHVLNTFNSFVSAIEKEVETEENITQIERVDIPINKSSQEDPAVLEEITNSPQLGTNNVSISNIFNVKMLIY